MNPQKASLEDLRIDRTSNPPRSSRPLVWALVVLLLAGLAGAGFWWFNRSRPLTVRTMVVPRPATGSRGERIMLNGTGYVTARRLATVSSKFTGKVVEVLVEEGMKVEAGQILARIDSINVEKSHKLAQAQAVAIRKGMQETEALITRAAQELKRTTQLASEKIATVAELERADADLKSLLARLEKQKADVTVAEGEVAIWNQQLEDTVIRAPFAGIVTSKNAQPGEMISPMSSGGFTRTGICTLVDMSSLEVEVEVSESYINRVEPGQPVEATLDSYPEWRIPCRVTAIIPTADRANATVKVRVGFDKLDPRILPQMAVKVAFQHKGTTPQATVLDHPTLPRSAVRQHEGRDVVWLVSGGKVERRTVTIASTRGEEVTVAAGVSGGEQVVVEGHDGLQPGARVKENKP